MALLQPDPPPAGAFRPHPALCFFTGIALIFAAGLLVHLAFRVIL
jgi:hypothetical protein